MKDFDAERILKSFPSKYYVINRKTKKIVQTNDDTVERENQPCFTHLFNKTSPCDNIDGQCICEVLAKDKDHLEFMVEKNVGEKTEFYKANAFVIDQDLVIAKYTDISEQIHFKNELQINNQRLKRAENLAEFGYWEYNVAESTMYASEGAKKIYGLSKNSYFIDEIRSISLSEYQPALNLELDNLINHGQPYNIKFKISRKNDGSVRRVHSIAEYNREKKIVYGVLHDITEKRATQEALKESEASLKLLFENMNNAFAFCQIITDGQGNTVDYLYLNVNSKFEELIDKKRGDIVNKTVRQLFPNLQAGWIQRYGKVAFTGESMTFTDYLEILDKHLDVSVYSPKKGYFAATFSDVTSRVKSENALQESLSDLTFSQRIGKIGSWKYSAASEIPQWSEQVFQIFDRDPQKGPIAMSEMENYLDTQFGSFANALKSASESGNPFDLELRIQLPGGQLKWVELICEPDSNKGPNGHFLRGSLQDITESKLNQDEVRRSNQLLSTVINVIPDAIYLKDANYRKLLANKGDVHHSGKNKVDDLLGKSDYDLYPKEIADQYHEDDKRVIEQGETIVNREVRLPLPGDERWVLTSKYPFRNDRGEIVGLVGIARDITPLKKQQMKLGLLEQTIEQIPLTVAITDTNGTIEYVNPGFVKSTGYSKDEAIGQNPRFLKSGTQSPVFYEQLWETILSGKIWIGEFHNKKKNGEFYWESAVVAPIFNDKNEITHFVAIKEDVSEKRQMIVELQNAKEKAEESNRLKTLFLANMSHEIRTPLNGILGFSSIVCSMEYDKEKLEHFGRLIENSGRRLITVIDDIIDISMIQSNQLKINYQTFNINELLEEINAFYTSNNLEILEKLDFQVSFCKQDGTELICSDKNRIYQVMRNLLENSFKFTQNGSIKFGCLKATKNELTLFVKDSGIGIDKSKSDIIFESFRQADEGSVRKYEGSGLGLAIVAGVVEKLGGKITLDSQLGQGTTFYISLPRNEGKIENVEQRNTKAPIENTKQAMAKNIVSIEDDQTSAEYLKSVAKLLGYQITNFDSPIAGIEYLKNNRPDLVLMDVQLPDMSGYEATKTIKKMHPGLPVIIQTAYAMKGDKKRALEAGCDDYMTKPLSLNIFKTMLAKYLG